MFNKLKQYKDLRSQAKKMQNALADESVTIEKNGVTLVMNGNMEVVSLKSDDNTTKETLESVIPGMMNEGIKKMQRIMATKMQEMGGLSGLGM